MANMFVDGRSVDRGRRGRAAGEEERARGEHVVPGGSEGLAEEESPFNRLITCSSKHVSGVCSLSASTLQPDIL